MESETSLAAGGHDFVDRRRGHGPPLDRLAHPVAADRTLVGLDPQAIDYAREARPYACVQLLGVLQVICFLRIQRRGTGRARLAWIFLTWLMFYTHYTSILLLLGELFYLILAWRCRRWELRRDAVGWLFDFSLCVAGMLAAWSPLLAIAARRQNWARFVPQAAWTETVRLFAVQVYVLAPAIIVLLLAGLVYSRGVRWQPRSQLVQALTFCSCWYSIPVFTAWVCTQQDWARLLFRRYLIVVGLVPMVISGVLGGLLPRGRSRTRVRGGDRGTCPAVVHPFRSLVRRRALVASPSGRLASCGPLDQPRPDGWTAAGLSSTWIDRRRRIKGEPRPGAARLLPVPAAGALQAATRATCPDRAALHAVLAAG